MVAALSQHVRRLPASLRRSLTWDRGLEMAQHKSFTVDTEVKVYFCDPQSPGSAARTKIQMARCVSTFLKEQTCQGILKRSSTKWPCD